jgi:hypothetical protein
MSIWNMHVACTMYSRNNRFINTTARTLTENNAFASRCVAVACTYCKGAKMQRTQPAQSEHTCRACKWRATSRLSAPGGRCSICTQVHLPCHTVTWKADGAM